MGHRFLSILKKVQNHNEVHCISLAHSTTVYPLTFFVIPPSIYPQSIQRDMTLYISLCPSCIHCKVKEMNVSPGKIHGSSVYSLGLLLLLLHQDRYKPFSFFPPSLFYTCILFFFSSLNGISCLVIDSNVNHWKPFSKSKKTACFFYMYIQIDCCLTPASPNLFDILFVSSVNDPFVNALIIFRK